MLVQRHETEPCHRLMLITFLNWLSCKYAYSTCGDKSRQIWLGWYQSLGLWDGKAFFNHVAEWAKDVPECIWYLFLPQPPPSAMSSANRSNILCMGQSVFMTTPWSYCIALDLFQCQGLFVDLNSRGTLKPRLLACAKATKWTGGLSPA